MIPEYGGKLRRIYGLVSVKNIFAHKAMTEGHKVTLIAIRFRNYATISWAELQTKKEEIKHRSC